MFSLDSQLCCHDWHLFWEIGIYKYFPDYETREKNRRVLFEKKGEKLIWVKDYTKPTDNYLRIAQTKANSGIFIDDGSNSF